MFQTGLPYGEQLSGHLPELDSSALISPIFIVIFCILPSCSHSGYFFFFSFMFFYFFISFFPALPLLFFPLWLSKGRAAPAQPGKHGLITKAQVGSSPAIFLPLGIDSLASQ